MLDPQDLPGRYGRVVKAVDHLLQIIGCPAVLGGGWAVWRHGYVGRVTQDIDIALPADRIAEFLRAAAVAGFDVLPVPRGPVKRYACAGLPPATACSSVVTTGAWPTTSAKRRGRHLRYRTC